MTLKQAKAQLKEIGITMSKTQHGEFRINFANGKEETAYYGDSIDDAVMTGRAMAAMASQKSRLK